MTRTKITRTRRNQLASILFAATIMFSAAANAESASAQHKGTLNIKTETVVEGTTLPPGNYEIRETKTADGAMVEFVRKYWNEAASELVQAEQDQLIARVPVSEQPINERPAHTKLQLAADTKTATALEIRHVPVDYVFKGSGSQSQTAASTNCVNGMQ